MRRNWKSLLQDTSYKRLALAIVVSLLIHVALIEKFYFDLPISHDPPIFIDAELIAAPQKFLGDNLIKHREKKLVKAPVKVKKQTVSQLEKTVPETAKVEPPDSVSESPVLNSINMPDELSNFASDSQVEDVAVQVNTDAYQYVETEYDVRTNLNASVNSSPDGQAKIVYQLSSDGQEYTLNSLIQAKGLASLVIPDLLQSSVGKVTDKGLQPETYHYQFGNKKDKNYTAKFNWLDHQLTLNSAKGDKELPLEAGTQDLLSFMYQFMFVAPLQQMFINVTNGKKISTYDYSFEGEKVISTKMGDLNTAHLLHKAAESDDKTEMWLALDYQYLPVKIRKTSKEGKTYELLVTSLKTKVPESNRQ